MNSRRSTEAAERARNQFIAIVVLSFLVIFLPGLGIPLLIVVLVLLRQRSKANRIEDARFKVYADGSDNR